MTAVAVLGAGAGGAAAAVELTLAGHAVRLWGRSAATLDPFRAEGGIGYEGVLGSGRVVPARVTSDLAEALDKAEVVVVCLPTHAHGAIAAALIEAGATRAPVVLNPGHVGGALEVHAVFTGAARVPPPIAEFSTLTYVARKYAPACVTVSGRAGRLGVAGMPGGESAVAAARALFPAAEPRPDVLATSLADVNLVLHPPGAVLAAAWVEATAGDFTFYGQGMTPGVARVMAALDGERLAVARAFGHVLPPLLDEMAAIGTVDAADAATGDLRHAISGGAANARIKAPDGFDHRYYVEDFGHGLVPFRALARAAGVPVPVADALLGLGTIVTGRDFEQTGRTARRMGIDGLNAAQVRAKVRGER